MALADLLAEAKALMREEIPALAFVADFTDRQALEVALRAYVEDVRRRRKRSRRKPAR